MLYMVNPLNIVLLAVCTTATAQDSKPPKAAEGQPKVVRDQVTGSIHHDGGKRQWERITGNVQVLDANTLLFEDGTRFDLGIVAPDLDQMVMIDGSLYPAGKEAAKFLSTLIGGRPVTSLGYVGDTHIEHAMIINGWALANHSSMHAAEIIARENKRGLWRGKFIDPEDWRAGMRLPEEPSPSKLDEAQATKLIQSHGRSEAALAALISRIAKDIPEVRSLNFRNSKVTNDGLAQLARLTALEKLNLHGCEQITAAGLAHLEVLSRLKHLDLPLKTTDDGLAHVKTLTELKHLDLNYGSPTDAGLAHLANLTQLEHLGLGYAVITDAGLSHLKGLHRLRHLALYNTKITDAGLEHVSAFQNLVVLDIHQTRVTDRGLAVVSKLVNLEYLDASGDDITDAGVEQLIGLKRLTVLKIPARVSNTTRNRLREALPGLKFEGRPADVELKQTSRTSREQ